jgi:hypothetical protein
MSRAARSRLRSNDRHSCLHKESDSPNEYDLSGECTPWKCVKGALKIANKVVSAPARAAIDVVAVVRWSKRSQAVGATRPTERLGGDSAAKICRAGADRT